MRYVYVKESQIPFAGEGLWAKTDIKVNALQNVAKNIKLYLTLTAGWKSSCLIQWCQTETNLGSVVSAESLVRLQVTLGKYLQMCRINGF